MRGSTTSAYPTMHLFRQPKPGNWFPVLQQMAAELPSLLSAQGTAPRPAIPIVLGDGNSRRTPAKH